MSVAQSLHELTITDNIKFVFNKFSQIDGDSKGVYLMVDNDCLRNIVKKNHAIPAYAPYIYKKDLVKINKWIKKAIDNL